MIDRDLKRCIGQMVHGIHVVAAEHDGQVRAYCSHWVCQVSFEEPILLASISPRHDTHPLVVAAGAFTVSVLAGDQVEEAQYFSYPGRRMHHVATEMIERRDGHPVVPGCVAWLHAVVEERLERYDHDLFLARVVAHGEGRLGEPPLVYSARGGWRSAATKVRKPGDGVRDRLLARVDEEATDELGEP